MEEPAVTVTKLIAKFVKLKMDRNGSQDISKLQEVSNIVFGLNQYRLMSRCDLSCQNYRRKAIEAVNSEFKATTEVYSADIAEIQSKLSVRWRTYSSASAISVIYVDTITNRPLPSGLYEERYKAYMQSRLSMHTRLGKISDKLSDKPKPMPIRLACACLLGLYTSLHTKDDIVDSPSVMSSPCIEDSKELAADLKSPFSNLEDDEVCEISFDSPLYDLIDPPTDRKRKLDEDVELS